MVGEKSGSVIELDASTRALVRVISGPAYHFSSPVGPVALAFSGDHLFVANPDNNSLTELDSSTGRWRGSSQARGTTSTALAAWP